MSQKITITIAGTGAVSSAGWGVESLWQAVRSGTPVAVESLPHPSGEAALARKVRRVPKPDPRPAFLAHPRLRRASVISHFAAAAALEAVPPGHQAAIKNGTLRTGIVCSLLNGSVNYSARFHSEILKDPATASPMLFPETVFNAPASHVAALLGITAPVTTVLGDSAQFFPAVEIAVQWLLDGVVDTCLVIGAEEADWLTAEALALLAPGAVLSEGAGAVYLEKNGPGPLLAALHGPCPVLSSRAGAAAALFAELSGDEAALLITDRSGHAPTDSPTLTAAASWPGPQSHPRLLLGESLGAAAALQTVLAVRSLEDGRHSRVIAAATGGNMQAAALELHAV